MQDVWRQEGSKTARSDSDQLDALAAQVARGVRPAFEQIYLLLVDDLYGYARSHTSNDSSAEDVVATIFLKAWQYGRRYRAGSESYRRWVFGIARNEVRNHWRSEQRSRVLSQELEKFAIKPAQTTTAEFDEAMLRSALEKLTNDQRDVVTLRYFGGKSHREIAEILGKREGGVRALQHRALRQLRKVVADAAP